MFNQEYFNSLNQQDKEKINTLYNHFVQQKTSMQEFLEGVSSAVGQSVLNNLLTKGGEPIHGARPENFSDILLNTGVDLKQEQDIIIGDENSQYEAGEDEGDPHLDPQSLVDQPMFYDFVNKIALTRQMKIADSAYQTLFMILKRKIYDMIDQIIEASKIRIDIERSEFEKTILNDVRRQLWILEQNEIKAFENLQIKTEDEGRRKIKKSLHEREDIIVKKRQSNTVALAALGSKKFNWMDDATQEDKDRAIESLYAPYDEKEFIGRIKNRTITIEDFLYVLEHDKRYNKSYFLLQQYFNLH